jgi:hypothetical protein
VKYWLWRAVDQTGIVLDVLVQRRRDKQAAKRLLPTDVAQLEVLLAPYPSENDMLTGEPAGPRRRKQ